MEENLNPAMEETNTPEEVIEEFEGMYNKHYVRINDNNCIIEGWSDGPHNHRTPTEQDILINDKGGYQFRLVIDGTETEENPSLFEFDYMIPLYKWDGTQVLRRTEEEIEAERTIARTAMEAAEAERLANSPEARIAALEDALCEADEENEIWKANIEDALCEISAESEG